MELDGGVCGTDEGARRVISACCIAAEAEAVCYIPRYLTTKPKEALLVQVLDLALYISLWVIMVYTATRSG